MPRPLLLSALAVLQFLAAGAAAIVLLGNGTLDSELSPADIAGAVGVAIAGAVAAGSSWNGGRVGWWFQLVAALAIGAFGAYRAAEGDLPVIVGCAVVWLVILLVPSHKHWFETTVPA